MNDEVLIAILGAIASIIGVILTNRAMLQRQSAQLDKDLSVFQARMTERVDELTREVRAHNELVARMYSAEALLQAQSARIEVLEHQQRPSA